MSDRSGMGREAAPGDADAATAALRRRLFACIAASVLLLAALMHHAGLRVDPWAWSNMPFYLIAALAMGLGIALRSARGRLGRSVRDVAEYVAAFTVLALLGAVGSYPVAAVSHGFVDPALQRIDVALGFDWVALYRLVAAHRVLQIAGRAAYETIYLSPIAILATFAANGRRDRAQAMIATFWVAAMLTLVLFWFMPAIGPLGYLWRGPVPYVPASELWQPRLIPPLRDHAVHVIDLGRLVGLVSAPSFHTTAALLYVAFAWPERRLRWPVAAVNAAMLLSTPIEGTHYLADMLAGAGVAALAWSGVAWATARGGARAPRARWPATQPAR